MLGLLICHSASNLSQASSKKKVFTTSPRCICFTVAGSSGKASNGVESFWAMLKRGYYGTYHRISEKHLERYVNEFSGRHNDRPSDTIDQMAFLAKGMVGKKLPYKVLVN